MLAKATEQAQQQEAAEKAAAAAAGGEASSSSSSEAAAAAGAADGGSEAAAAAAAAEATSSSSSGDADKAAAAEGSSEVKELSVSWVGPVVVCCAGMRPVGQRWWVCACDRSGGHLRTPSGCCSCSPYSPEHAATPWWGKAALPHHPPGGQQLHWEPGCCSPLPSIPSSPSTHLPSLTPPVCLTNNAGQEG
jgi:hypothetical protein